MNIDKIVDRFISTLWVELGMINNKKHYEEIENNWGVIDYE